MYSEGDLSERLSLPSTMTPEYITSSGKRPPPKKNKHHQPKKTASSGDDVVPSPAARDPRSHPRCYLYYLTVISNYFYDLN